MVTDSTQANFIPSQNIKSAMKVFTITIKNRQLSSLYVTYQLVSIECPKLFEVAIQLRSYVKCVLER